MSSRLFKHQMAMGNRPRPTPMLIFSTGEVFNINKATNEFTKIHDKLPGTPTNGSMVAISPNGKTVVIPGTKIIPNSIATHYFIRNLNVFDTFQFPFTSNNTGPMVAQFSHDGKFCYFGVGAEWDHSFFILQVLADGTLDWTNFIGRWHRLGPTVTSIAVSPDDKFIVVAFDGGHMEVYERNSDGTFIWASDDGSVPYRYQIDPVAKTVTSVGQTGLPGFCSVSMKTSKDGTYLAQAGWSAPMFAYYRYDGNGVFTELTLPESKPAECWAVAFSPDGKYLAAQATNATDSYVYVRTGDALTLVARPPIVATAQSRMTFSL